MQIDEELRAKLLKIKALAEGGVGGEKENAKRMLEKMCQSNGITVDDLDDEIEHKMTFKNHNMSKLAFQTLLYCFGKKACDEKVKYYHMKGFRNRRYLDMRGTASDILQAKVAINHYQDLYKQNKKSILKNMLSAFINRYELFPPEKDGGGGSSTLSYEDMMQIHNLMGGMSDDDGPRMPLGKLLGEMKQGNLSGSHLIK